MNAAPHDWECTEYWHHTRDLHVTWDGDEWIVWRQETGSAFDTPLDHAIADECLNALARDTPADQLSAEELKWLRTLAMAIDPAGELTNRERE